MCLAHSIPRMEVLSSSRKFSKTACENGFAHPTVNCMPTTTVLRLSGFCLGPPGWAGTKRNIHPLTPILIINHPLSASSIYYDPWHPPCSIHVPDSLIAQLLFKFSLVYLLVWHPPLHTPYISWPNHCLLFAAHAHTIAVCFAAELTQWKLEKAEQSYRYATHPLAGRVNAYRVTAMYTVYLPGMHWSWWLSSLSFRASTHT